MVTDAKQRDKVIYGLQCHGTDVGIPNICGVMECPYEQDKPWCNHDLARDALNLLHDLIPRKLTLSEIVTAINRPVWLIRNVFVDNTKEVVKSECWALVSGEEDYHFVVLATPQGIERRHIAVYGVGWECWTGEPSEIDRKAGCVLKGEDKDDQQRAESPD